MNSRQQKIAGIILAGGRSKRMGQNKALLPVGNITAVERVIAGVRPFAGHLLLITNDAPAFSFLNISMEKDLRPYEGPLAGLEAAMYAASADWYLLAACDMPLLQESVVNYLHDKTAATDKAAVVPSVEGRMQPLLAVYHRSTLSEITACLASERRSLRALLDSITFDTVTENDMIEAGVPKTDIASSFYNMNRPEEYERILERFS